jgi:BA14K-like protein
MGQRQSSRNGKKRRKGTRNCGPPPDGHRFRHFEMDQCGAATHRPEITHKLGCEVEKIMYLVWKSLAAGAAMLGFSLAFTPGASALSVPLVKHVPQSTVQMEFARHGGGGGHAPIWRVPGGGHGGRVYSGGGHGGRVYSGPRGGVNYGRHTGGRNYTAYQSGNRGNYIRRHDYQGQWTRQRMRRDYGHYGNYNRRHVGNYNNWHNGGHNNGHHHGYRHRHGHYNYYHNGYWYDWPWWLVGTGVGLYYGGYYGQPIYYNDGADAHTAWCMQRYRSYNPATDTYMGYDGYAHRCISPYDY